VTGFEKFAELIFVIEQLWKCTKRKFLRASS